MYVHFQAVDCTFDAHDTQNLRYKDYQLASKPAEIQQGSASLPPHPDLGVLRELSTVKAFSEAMHERQVHDWWRRGMGYDSRSI